MGIFRRVYRTDLTDNQIKRWWYLMQVEGRERDMLYDTQVPTMDEFVAWFRNPNIHPWIAYEGDRPVSLAYLSDKRGKTAWLHFAALSSGTRRIYGMPFQVAVSAFQLAKILWERNETGGFVMDTLLACVPRCRKSVFKLLSRLGLKPHSTLPGYYYFHDTGENVDGVVFVITRDMIPEFPSGF